MGVLSAVSGVYQMNALSTVDDFDEKSLEFVIYNIRPGNAFSLKYIVLGMKYENNIIHVFQQVKSVGDQTKAKVIGFIQLQHPQSIHEMRQCFQGYRVYPWNKSAYKHRSFERTIEDCKNNCFASKTFHKIF